jgi:predicted Zn-dependent protease
MGFLPSGKLALCRTRETQLRRIAAVVALLSVVLPLAAPARAQVPGVARIRDAEIETYLKQWATPVWLAAGLDPEVVKIVVVNEDQINAFVAGGQNIFIYTGLLMRSDSANQVIGVMAHETGHIVGGHLARMGDEIEKAEIIQIIGMILGAGATVATGNGGGMATGAGAGADLAVRNFLSFSRTQERSADQAGVTFLERSGQSARGLLEFMEKLQGEEFLNAQRQDPYLRTHPLTEDRVEFIRHFLETSKYASAPPRAGYPEEHERMVGKIVGFVRPVARVFQQYKEDDNSVGSRYARSIANHRLGKEAEALALIDSLLAEKPNDPYYTELKAQFLFEAGRVRDSAILYQRANALLPRNALIEAEMGQAMVEAGDSSYNQVARDALLDSVTQDRDNSLAWRILATVYGRDGDEGQATLALAEEAYADGRYKDARGMARRAQKMLPAGSPGALRAKDIEDQADRSVKEDK